MGISNNSPEIKLENRGGGNDASVIVFTESGTDRFSLGADYTDGSFKIGTTDLNVSNRFTIDSTGNVGIGTWNPAQKLHVVGTVAATAFIGDGSGLTNLPASGGWTDGGTNVYNSTTTDPVSYTHLDVYKRQR